jgi:hypothetical protein
MKTQTQQVRSKSSQQQKKQLDNKNKAVAIIRFCQLRMVVWSIALSALCLLPVRFAAASQVAA